MEATADGQTLFDYADALGNLREPGALLVLWRWVDEQVAFGPSLRAITLFARPQDLPRLAVFLTAKNASRDYYGSIRYLPEELYEAYGADSVVYLERTLEASESRALRLSSVLALLNEDHPAAWAFAATAIENNSNFKGTLMTHINVLYPQPNADEASILTLAKRRAANRAP